MKHQRSLKPYLVPVTISHKSFTDVKLLHPIPTNCIIDKTLTGFGATHSEISNGIRNSIIVMANIALVRSKAEYYESKYYVLGVWGDIRKSQIKNFLISNRFPKKILTTPESFIRIVNIISELGGCTQENYFLLIDESHKLTKDVGYRDRIVEPMNLFFQFKGKALITATPITPSDPRFIHNKFKLLKVSPQYDYKKSLTVIHVNNIVKSLETYFNENPNVTYCIFVNSISIIKTIQAYFRIEQVSKVFCSTESATDLIRNGYPHARSCMDKLASFNFFTSSFYNGIDIKEDKVIDVIIISDVKSEHTLIDPLTDTKQILGRFRQPFVYRKATHFFTVSPKINYMPSEVIDLHLYSERTFYLGIEALTISNPRSESDQFKNREYEQALQKSVYSNFVSDSKLNYYKVDNFKHANLVKSYYLHPDFLKAAYVKMSQSLNVDFLNYNLIVQSQHRKVIRNGRRYSIENIKLLADTLHQLHGQETTDEYKEYLRQFDHHLPLMLQAFKKLGYSRFVELGYKKRDIEKAVIMHDFINGINCYPIVDAVHLKFSYKPYFTVTEVLGGLSDIYNEYGINPEAKTNHIHYFFHTKSIVKKIKGTAVRVFSLTQKKMNGHPDYRRN